ncbi:MAG: hypothetical protein DWI21_16435 [Planctomycetota bacterium]|nr:MAG: hypothetical protein DWI21_16435 [Planctomycetota bacterium]GDY07491.1 hypothetical protein LBMAG52_09770 [Planctomycetia bacterium]
MSQLTRSLMLCGVFALSSVVATPAWAEKIEAIKGKVYKLDKQHGPWMVMVASLSEPPPEARIDGPNMKEAANSLVFELRKKDIPAYIFVQEEEIQPLSTFKRGDKVVRREVKSKDNRICVVAGNYGSSEDRIAQKTLNWIKKFNPKELTDHAVFHPTPGRPGPLSGAFLTINPMLSAEEASQQKIDPLLVRLNAGRRDSLLANTGKYTLVVASFRGKSQLLSKPSDEEFEISRSLDDAGHQAEVLCYALREQKLHFGRQFDAFVWHDRDRSLVCIGSFVSDKDPLIPRMFEYFSERKQLNAQTQTEVVMPQSLLVPEPEKSNWVFPKLNKGISRDRKIAPLPKHTFAFDPKPQLMLVPKSGKPRREG